MRALGSALSLSMGVVAEEFDCETRNVDKAADIGDGAAFKIVGRPGAATSPVEERSAVKFGAKGEVWAVERPGTVCGADLVTPLSTLAGSSSDSGLTTTL